MWRILFFIKTTHTNHENLFHYLYSFDDLNRFIDAEWIEDNIKHGDNRDGDSYYVVNDVA